MIGTSISETIIWAVVTFDLGDRTLLVVCDGSSQLVEFRGHVYFASGRGPCGCDSPWHVCLAGSGRKRITLHQRLIEATSVYSCVSCDAEIVHRNNRARAPAVDRILQHRKSCVERLLPQRIVNTSEMLSTLNKQLVWWKPERCKNRLIPVGLNMFDYIHDSVYVELERWIKSATDAEVAVGAFIAEASWRLLWLWRTGKPQEIMDTHNKPLLPPGQAQNLRQPALRRGVFKRHGNGFCLVNRANKGSNFKWPQSSHLTDMFAMDDLDEYSVAPTSEPGRKLPQSKLEAMRSDASLMLTYDSKLRSFVVVLASYVHVQVATVFTNPATFRKGQEPLGVDWNAKWCRPILARPPQWVHNKTISSFGCRSGNVSVLYPTHDDIEMSEHPMRNDSTKPDELVDFDRCWVVLDDQHCTIWQSTLLLFAQDSLRVPIHQAWFGKETGSQAYLQRKTSLLLYIPNIQCICHSESTQSKRYQVQWRPMCCRDNGPRALFLVQIELGNHTSTTFQPLVAFSCAWCFLPLKLWRQAGVTVRVSSGRQGCWQGPRKATLGGQQFFNDAGNWREWACQACTSPEFRERLQFVSDCARGLRLWLPVGGWKAISNTLATTDSEASNGGSSYTLIYCLSLLRHSTRFAYIDATAIAWVESECVPNTSDSKSQTDNIQASLQQWISKVSDLLDEHKREVGIELVQQSKDSQGNSNLQLVLKFLPRTWPSRSHLSPTVTGCDVPRALQVMATWKSTASSLDATTTPMATPARVPV